MRVGWGVIGCGRIATNRTVPEGILAAANARLVAVTDLAPERAEAVAGDNGARVYATAGELLRDSNVEAVYIAVPPAAHAEVALLAAEHRKPTLLEKPIARTAREGEAIVAAFRAAEVPLGIGFMMRYHACHVRLRELLDEGAIGTVVAVRGRYSVWYPPQMRRLQEAWIFDPRQAGGGPLMDVGCHALDLMMQFAGPVDRLAALSDTLVHDLTVEDTCTVLLQFVGGAHGILQAYNCTPNFVGRNVVEVHGTRGTLVAQGTLTQLPTGTLTHFAKGAEEGTAESPGQAVSVQPVNTYRAEIERFSTCIDRGEPYPIGGEDGLANQRLIDAAYRSAQERAFVTIGEG